MRPVAIDQFAGLNLSGDPGEENGEAIDLLNVVIEPGRVRTRPGLSTFVTLPSTPTFLDVFPGASPQLIGCNENAGFTSQEFNAYNTAGAVVATLGLVGYGQPSGVAVGTPAGRFYYVTVAGTIRRFDGTTWTTPAGMPANPAVLSKSPADNRLVVCDTGSKVWFSDPGAPETFGANNFVQLNPGDGENILAATVFNNQLFIFKGSRFYVFYGTGTDGTGQPIFNYRVVETKAGMENIGSATPLSLAVSPDGVYFMGQNGVYLTAGSTPRKISGALDRLFAGTINAFTAADDVTPFWQAGAWQPSAQTSMQWVNGVLYLSLALSKIRGTLTYDTTVGQWSFWNAYAPGGFVAFQRSTTGGDNTVLYASVTSGVGAAVLGNKIVHADRSATVDVGSLAILSRYRTAFNSFGYRARRQFVGLGEKRLRETILEGTGAVTVQWSRDWGALVTGSAVQLGQAPTDVNSYVSTIATKRQRTAIRGRQFSLQLGASAGYWAVNRIQANLSDAVRAEQITV